jgi:hypothetical protein
MSLCNAIPKGEYFRTRSPHMPRSNNTVCKLRQYSKKRAERFPIVPRYDDVLVRLLVVFIPVGYSSVTVPNQKCPQPRSSYLTILGAKVLLFVMWRGGACSIHSKMRHHLLSAALISAKELTGNMSGAYIQARARSSWSGLRTHVVKSLLSLPTTLHPNPNPREDSRGEKKIFGTEMRNKLRLVALE